MASSDCSNHLADVAMCQTLAEPQQALSIE